MNAYGIQKPALVQQQESGFSTDKSLTLSDRNFNTGIKTSSYANLTNVTAHSIKTGSSCKLTACKIDHVKSSSYLEAKNSTFTGVKASSSIKLQNCEASSIKSGSYLEMNGIKADKVKSTSSCKIKDCPKIKKVSSGSYLEASNSKIDSANSVSSMKIVRCNAAFVKSGSYFEGTDSVIKKIEASSSAKLVNMQGVKLLTSGSYVEINNSSVETIDANSTLEAEYSQINDLKAGNGVRLRATSVNGELTAGSLDAKGGELVSVNVDGKADLISCNVIQKIFANKINGSNCNILGELNAKSDLTIKDSTEVGSVESRKATIINSQVIGDVKAINLKLINTRVGGTVTAANHELVLNNCHIAKLIMQKPQAWVELSTVQINEIFQRRDVPHDIRNLVEYVLLDKAKIEINDDLYKVTIGDSSIAVKAHSDSARNQFQHRILGSAMIVRGAAISLGGITMSTGGATMSGGKILMSGGEEYPMEILNNPQKILEAYNAVNQIKIDMENERRRLEELEPAPQVVVICGGHVEEIIFETKGGVVLFERGGTAGNIIKLQGEEISEDGEREKIRDDGMEKGAEVQKKTIKEPPEDFLSPITLELMEDPYITPLGHHFNKKDIIDIMAYNKGVFKCPLTRKEYKMDELEPDDKLRNQIEEWLKFHIAI